MYKSRVCVVVLLGAQTVQYDSCQLQSGGFGVFGSQIEYCLKVKQSVEGYQQNDAGATAQSFSTTYSVLVFHLVRSHR